ncbi:OHCU decarboxylase/putative urate catabolism protein [SAR116 cluster alpha proteobacterium HIMB100]|nr:OHCU decarboxylase/putative urate catabolism protein [SAR116 cluster alpha proteobacterium HIMB100]
MISGVMHQFDLTGIDQKTMSYYPRNMTGYGRHVPASPWPNKAKLAVQIVLNYEEGGERCVLHGDSESEAFLSEIVGAAPWPGQRHWNMESIYEYGARSGFWRLHDLFTARGIPITVFGVTKALARAPEQVAAMKQAGWEIACHGLKWIDYKDHSPDQERAAIAEAIRLHEAVVGTPPKGWYTGRCSEATIDLVAEQAECTYQADSYADDLPYYQETPSGPQLIVPYTLDANDMRFATPQGFNSGPQFFDYLKDTFDALYEEGCTGAARLMSIGLHCRLVGRPGRIQALKAFLDYVAQKPDIWFATRLDLAECWQVAYPYQPRFRPSQLDRQSFISVFGSVFEHSPWVAEQAYDGERSPAMDSPVGLHTALSVQFRLASEEQRLGVLNAHPDLAGKLAKAKKLTAASTSEQAAAGLDILSEDDQVYFTQLNNAYKQKFPFPFILAVKGRSASEIKYIFETRLLNTQEQEFTEACQQVEKIARLRVDDVFAQQAQQTGR